MENLFIYVENEKAQDCLKYGMKLSEYANKIIEINNIEKKGITAYLTPKDSDLYDNNLFTCLRISTSKLNAIIYNRVFENNKDFLNKSFCNCHDYQLADYEDPIGIIYSTILPENIFLYNKLLDLPLIVENSKEYFYDKCVNDLIENDKFTKFELYQTLLLLGEQKNIFKSEKIDHNLKIYTDLISNKIYTKKNSGYETNPKC
ncbi:MAG: hypothetical protein Q4D02_00705 [Clostridia bacterium]|nr:hypothetical protein [Clostridia bacterium]